MYTMPETVKSSNCGVDEATDDYTCLKCKTFLNLKECSVRKCMKPESALPASKSGLTFCASCHRWSQCKATKQTIKAFNK